MCVTLLCEWIRYTVYTMKHEPCMQSGATTCANKSHELLFDARRILTQPHTLSAASSQCT